MSRRPFLPPWVASPPGLNLGSRLMGDLAHAKLPPSVLRTLIRAYARHYGLDLDEMAAPIESYQTFAEFFTRRLRPGARPLDRSPGVVTSPVDGKVQSMGRLEDGRFDQVKGHGYSVETFLGGASEALAYREGWYAVLYLSPADYHRIHSPLDGEITRWTHIPGTLCSVQPFFCNLVAGLLVSNERVLSHMDTSLGAVVVGMVGACGVGRIRLAYDGVETNVEWGARRQDETMDPPVSIRKGDEIGLFDLGSTVVLIMNNNDLRPVPGLEPGVPVRCGARLFERSE
ncbi:MAG: archaetidylserine decarboxylase [Pseudomonadota bacterium]